MAKLGTWATKYACGVLGAFPAENGSAPIPAISEEAKNNVSGQRLRELGLELPSVPTPAANYANCVRTGNLIFLSGTVPMMKDGSIPKGKVGADITTEQAAKHAQQVGLNLLAILKQELGDVSRVRRIVKLLGMVNATPAFLEHSKAINGCSTFSLTYSAKSMLDRQSEWEAYRSVFRSRSRQL